MNALNLHVEKRAGIDEQPEPVADNPGKGDLIGPFYPLEALLQCRVGAMVRELGDGGRILEHLRAQYIAEQLGQPGIGLIQPAPEGDAVRDIDDAAGVESLQIGEQRIAQELGVQRRHAVGAMRADKGEMAHPDAPAVVFVDQRNRGRRRFADRLGALSRQMMLVDLVDNLQVPRQYPIEQRNRPGFECFRQQGVIGIGAGRDSDFPGPVPRHVVQVDKDAHQLRNGDARVGVVELNGGVIGQSVDATVRAAVPLHEVLERSGDEKIFLPQTQLAPGRGRVARVEDLGERLGPRLFGQRANMVAEVEDVETHRIGSPRRPQAQCVDRGSAPPDDRSVVGNGADRFGRMPDAARTAGARRVALHPAAIVDVIGDLGPLEFPRI